MGDCTAHQMHFASDERRGHIFILLLDSQFKPCDASILVCNMQAAPNLKCIIILETHKQ